MEPKDRKHLPPKQLLADERLVLPRRPGGDLRVFVGYANEYWLGMSNLGFQTVCALFGAHPRLNVERFFFAGGDSEPRTLETGAQLSSADVLALSVSFEADYLNILPLLHSAGTMPRLDGSRSELGPLVLGGGAALTVNPEPVAPFFDAILIGEGDEAIPEIAEALVRARDLRLSRCELLERLTEIEGVYVPSLFRVSYSKNGRIDSFIGPGYSDGRQRPRRRIVRDLDPSPTHSLVVTPNTEFGSMFLLESGRGCEMSCRFCVSGWIYRPVRRRSTRVLEQIIENRAAAGEDIGLFGAAVSRHPAVTPLLEQAAISGRRLSLSSLMSQTITEALAVRLGRCGCRSVALAPEAGSEELRFRAGKRVCDEEILHAAATLVRAGISSVKLYFMIGLPGEDAADAAEIVALSRRVLETMRAAKADPSQIFRLTLSVNAFIPKPWTPFQRYPLAPVAELRQRFAVLKKGVGRVRGLELRSESPRAAYMQALLSRGDRRLAEVLLGAWHRDRGWKGLVSPQRPELAEQPPHCYAHRYYDKEEILPWEIIDMRIDRSLLEREAERAASGDVAGLIARAKAALGTRAAAHPPQL